VKPQKFEIDATFANMAWKKWRRPTKSEPPKPEPFNPLKSSPPIFFVLVSIRSCFLATPADVFLRETKISRRIPG
jgi:hypothetical protein